MSNFDHPILKIKENHYLLLCFIVAIPPSLRNIYKELNNDQKVDFSNHLQAPNKSRNGLPSHGYLKRWAQQGVLMLNSVLTVRSGQANSHKGKGWERFTDEVIRIVESNAQNGKLVFLLWGKPASKKAHSKKRDLPMDRGS